MSAAYANYLLKQQPPRSLYRIANLIPEPNLDIKGEALSQRMVAERV